MAITVKEPERKFTPAPEGLQQAVCCDVVELGMVETTYGTKEMVEIRWELEALNDEFDPARPFIARQRYNSTLAEKAKLRQHLETWRGRKFMPDELKGFDLERLIGVNCQLQIVHNIADDGRVWANIQAIVPHNSKLPKLSVSADYVREKDRPKDRDLHAAATARATKKAAEVDDDIPF